MEFQSQAQTAHRREQEDQWARILSAGRPVEGMVLLFVQKLCAAFHEFEPAWRAGALNAGGLLHVRKRLAARVRRVLDALRAHGLDGLTGASDLAALLQQIEGAATMKGLIALSEEMHDISHTLYDGLEARVRQQNS